MSEIIDIVEPAIPGSRGDQGPAGEIVGATATALPTGAEPTVTLGGTPSERTIEFGLPRGPKGDPGDGSVNSVNGDLGPDVILDAADVGAVPSNQYATTTQRGIVELATDAEAAGGADDARALTAKSMVARERARPEVYYPKDYGALGDGVKDDTTDLQSALDAAAGGTLDLGAGTYMISDRLTIHEGTTMRGNRATIRRVSGTHAVMLGNYNASDTTTTAYNGPGNITLEGLTFDGNSAPVEENMVLFVHSHDVVVRDCTFLTCTGYHHLEFNAVRDALVENCKFRGFIPVQSVSFRKEAIQIDCPRPTTPGGSGDGTPSINVTVDKCYFGEDHLGNPPPNICVGMHNTPSGGSYRNIIVTNCVGEGMRTGGVWLQDCDYATVQGNVFEVATLPPAHYNESVIPYSVILLHADTRFTIISDNVLIAPTDDVHDIIALRNSANNNTISGNSGKGGRSSILVYQSDNVSVLNNTLEACSLHGMLIDGSLKPFIAGNHIIAPGQAAGAGTPRILFFNGATISGTVTGNVSTPTSGVTIASGVAFASGTDSNLVMGNRFRGVSAVISGSGASNNTQQNNSIS